MSPPQAIASPVPLTVSPSHLRSIMKVTLERDALRNHLAWVAQFAGGHLPATHGIHLEAADGTVTLTAGRAGGVHARTTLEATVSEPGAALLPSRLTAQALSRMPKKTVQFALTEAVAELTCGPSTFRLRTLRLEDYPTFDFETAETSSTLEVSTSLMQRLVTQVGLAASNDEARPTLTGVNLHIEGDKLTAAATDSYRLAVRGASLDDSAAEPISALVPVSELAGVVKNLGDSGPTCKLTLESGRVLVRTDTSVAVVQLLEGSFPDHERLMPDLPSPTVSTVSREELLEVVGRVAVVGGGAENTPVHLSAGPDEMLVQMTNTEVGDAAEALACSTDGGELAVAFNPAFLVQALKSTGADKVALHFRDSLKPVVLMPQSDDGKDLEDFKVLLMPMRVS